MKGKRNELKKTTSKLVFPAQGIRCICRIHHVGDFRITEGRKGIREIIAIDQIVDGKT